jgi:hypothetical protein
MIIPTYDAELNEKLGGGLTGLVEIYGDEGVGKTGLALSLFTHQEGVFIDMDGTFPYPLVPVGSERNVTVVRPVDPTAENISAAANAISRQGGICIIDPVGILTAKEIERLMPNLGHPVERDSGLIVVVNHTYADGSSKGERYTTLYTSQRIEVREGAQWKKGGKAIGMKSPYRITKNSLKAPYGEGVLEIQFKGNEN